MKILVIEDEKDVRDLIIMQLEWEGHEPVAASSGEEAFKVIKNDKVDVIIADWMLPGISGLEICKKIRASKGDLAKTPILMLTARAETADIIRGLDAGADDYITKPFEIPVLMARVKALLRRSKMETKEQQTLIQHGSIALNTETYIATVNEIKLELTRYEFKLLHALLINAGRVLSRERLIQHVQGDGVAVTDRTIDTLVFGIRKKLGEEADTIETIRGIGYRIGG
jgi:two-component system phosphate regulon response regulator PhoB